MIIPAHIAMQAINIGWRIADDAAILRGADGTFSAEPRFVGARPRGLGEREPGGALVVALWYYPKVGTEGGLEVMP